jgi:hypothetical protein
MPAPEALRLERAVDGVGVVEFEQTFNADGSTKRREYWFTPEDGVRRRRSPSVTGILRDTWPPSEGLRRWIAEQGPEGPAVLEQAAQRGAAVHRFLEHYFTSGTIADLDDYSPGHWPYLQAAAAFVWEYDPQPLEVEQLVIHPEYGYAGRPDLVARVADVPTLLDFKSNSKGRIYPEAHVQTTAYAIARERCGDPPTEQTLLVGLDEQGGARVVRGLDVPKVWAAVLAFHEQIRRLEKTLNGGPS